MPSADQVPVNSTHSTMRLPEWVVPIAGSTGSALRAVRPFQPSHHAGCQTRSLSRRECDGFLVALAPGHHCPSHSGHLVGKRDGSNLGGPPRQQRCKPDNTPLHPEYPCAHCINSGAAVAVIESVLGSTDIPEVSMTSSTAPGVIHHWTNLGVFADEVANARIWAGFHYRFSTRVGTDMGRKIGQYVVKNVMKPTTAT